MPRKKALTPPPPEDQPLVPQTGAKRHSRLGPSGFKSVEVCPSYVNDSKETLAATKGSLAHGLLEQHHINVTRHQEFLLLDSDDQQYSISLIAGYMEELYRGKIDGAWTIEREVELDLKMYQIPDCEFGTADELLHCKATNEAHLVDYKFGWWEVDDAEYNIQGWLYALGVFARLPWCSWVTVHFLQPKRDEVSTYRFNRQADISRMLVRAKAIAERRKEKAGVEFSPVMSNCLWCGNKASCKALHEIALKVMSKTPVLFPENVDDLTPETFNDPESAGMVHEIAQLMEKWADQIKRRITQLALEGWEIPGKDIRHVSGKTRIIDPIRVYEIMEDKYGIDINRFLADFCDVALGRLESHAGSIAARGEKDNAKKELRKLFAAEGLVTVGQPSAYLVDAKSKTDQ